MALKRIGYVPCPSCGKAAMAGISRNGTGNAVHVICMECVTQVQLARDGFYGQFVVESASSEPMDGNLDCPVFTVWDFELEEVASKEQELARQ